MFSLIFKRPLSSFLREERREFMTPVAIKNGHWLKAPPPYVGGYAKENAGANGRAGASSMT